MAVSETLTEVENGKDRIFRTFFLPQSHALGRTHVHENTVPLPRGW